MNRQIVSLFQPALPMNRNAKKIRGLSQPPTGAMLSLEERVRAALQTNRKAAIEFVFAEVASGLGFCRLARSVPQQDWKHGKGIQYAREALQVAQKYMWKLGMTHPDFDQMMAQTERLQFELEDIDTRNEGTKE